MEFWILVAGELLGWVLTYQWEFWVVAVALAGALAWAILGLQELEL